MGPNFVPAAPALSKLSVKPQSHGFPDGALSFGATHTWMRGHVEAEATPTKQQRRLCGFASEAQRRLGPQIVLSRSESVGVKT